MVARRPPRPMSWLMSMRSCSVHMQKQIALLSRQMHRHSRSWTTLSQEANNIRQGSVQYTDDMLRSLQTIIKHSMEGAQSRFESYMSSMQSSYDVVSSNRNELAGSVVTEPEENTGARGSSGRYRRHPAKQQNKENERETGVNQFPQYIMPDGKVRHFFFCLFGCPV